MALEPYKLPRCVALAARVPRFHVLIDSLGECTPTMHPVLAVHTWLCWTEGLAMLEGAPLPDGARWNVFMKVDAGYRRTGVIPGGALDVALAISKSTAAV